jgi:hypothetical protein
MLFYIHKQRKHCLHNGMSGACVFNKGWAGLIAVQKTLEGQAGQWGTLGNCRELQAAGMSNNNIKQMRQPSLQSRHRATLVERGRCRAALVLAQAAQAAATVRPRGKQDRHILSPRPFDLKTAPAAGLPPAWRPRGCLPGQVPGAV